MKRFLNFLKLTPRHKFPQRPKLAWDVCFKCGMVNRAEAYIYYRCVGPNR